MGRDGAVLRPAPNVWATLAREVVTVVNRRVKADGLVPVASHQEPEFIGE
jgi:hypothetical protein